MKLTKEIISVLKYQGFMTSTSDTEIFLANYDTVEELGDAGFIGDRGAIDFLRNIFDENGVNMVGETKEEDVVEPEYVELEEKVMNIKPAAEPEKVEETTTEPEKVEEKEETVAEPEKVEETTTEPEKVEEKEETVAEPEKVEETEKPKKKGRK